jgi:hypothetical protein
LNQVGDPRASIVTGGGVILSPGVSYAPDVRRRIPVFRSRITWLWIGYFVVVGVVAAKYQSTLPGGDGATPSSTWMNIAAGLIAPVFILISPIGVITWPIMGLLTWAARRADLLSTAPTRSRS